MLNKVILMGRLTADPKVDTLQGGTVVGSFTMAVDRDYIKQGEDRQTDFIPVKAFGKNAEFAGKYFKKGQLVAVSGRLQVSSWEDKEGKRRYTTEVLAQELHFAEPKKNQAEVQNVAPPEGFIQVADENLPF